MNKVGYVVRNAQENPNRQLEVDYQRRLEHSYYPTYTKILEDARSGKLTINEAAGYMRRDKKIEDRFKQVAQAAKELALPADRVLLLNKDSMDLDNLPEVKDNSIELIVTDPPYPKKYLEIFEQLAEFASCKLKRGGSLVFYYNRYFLPVTVAMLAKYKDQLTYWWTFAVSHTGTRRSKIYERNVVVDWKEMLGYVKGKEPLGICEVHDFIQSDRPNKMAHPWAQSRVEAEYLIKSLTMSKDAVICDPFLGSREFVIPAIKLGRYVIGIEKDRETFKRAVDYIKTETASERA